MENNKVQLLASLLDADDRWTACELAAEVGVCHKTVPYVLHDIMGYCKLAAHWIPYEISEVQQWYCYAVIQALLDRYQRKDDYLLGRIVVMDKTWACSYKINLKHLSNKWKLSSSHPKNVCPTQCTPRHTINTVYNCTTFI